MTTFASGFVTCAVGKGMMPKLIDRGDFNAAASRLLGFGVLFSLYRWAPESEVVGRCPGRLANELDPGITVWFRDSSLISWEAVSRHTGTRS